MQQYNHASKSELISNLKISSITLQQGRCRELVI